MWLLSSTESDFKPIFILLNANHAHLFLRWEREICKCLRIVDNLYFFPSVRVGIVMLALAGMCSAAPTYQDLQNKLPHVAPGQTFTFQSSSSSSNSASSSNQESSSTSFSSSDSGVNFDTSSSNSASSSSDSSSSNSFSG